MRSCYKCNKLNCRKCAPYYMHCVTCDRFCCYDCDCSADEESRFLVCSDCSDMLCAGCAFKAPGSMEECGGCKEAWCGGCNKMRRCKTCGETFCTDCYPGCDCRTERSKRQ